MSEKLRQFAEAYASAEDQLIGSGDGRSSIHYPAVFLFIGGRCGMALKTVMEINSRKWDNSAGVAYIHVAAQAEALRTSGGAFGHVIPPLEELDNKTKRSGLHRAFYNNEEQLVQLNAVLRKAGRQLAEYGKLYSSFERVHLSVITCADDALNAVVAEITLLADYILGQSFKSVQTDLYTLMEESPEEQYGYSSAINVAFLRELEWMQSPEFTFSAPLHMTEERLAIQVEHAPAPLFDLVYLLSDKDERGMIVQDELRQNCEMICHIQLLKNRSRTAEQYRPQDGGYNNTSFKNNIMTGSGRAGYVSAGFSRVKRPNESIALTVLYHFYVQLLERLKSSRDWSMREKLAYFGLDASDRTALLDSLLPDRSAIGDMTGLMTSGVGYGSLKRMTLQEAEKALFGEGCRMFFRQNFEEEAADRLRSFDTESWLRSKVSLSAAAGDAGIYELLEWTDEQEAGSVLSALRSLIRDMARDLAVSGAELEALYAASVEDQPFQRLPLLDKHNTRSLIRYLTETVYSHKLNMLRLYTELEILRRCEAVLEQFHRQTQVLAAELEQVKLELRTASEDSIRLADQYTGQNLFEYYEHVTAAIMTETETRRGRQVFFEDRFMGPAAELLHNGMEGLVDRLLLTCRSLILSAEPFKQTFEEELLRRANVASDYNNRQIVPQDELFKRLYRTLEENAVIHVRLLDYTHEHRYEERYFFGDYEGEFLPYALGVDDTSRLYKTGFVHEKRSSGVEKLQLMGGFHTEDLMVYRNGKTYYETYTANGYELHGIAVEQLPEMR
ncbi:transcription initiation factor TFIID [Paenibacillus sp. P96]|uniref:Transcription initiation factor TFIID n=1 Tax=Paenibacillus zeirhizosphaerae TaxID=2987519 RepID=A0ABT9FRD0_9BACL|nr:transcription initiation factor TFIID [Paenibacillus sp. P96]MDP4097294.1 transcription initiation factor TFIID [Paenibacillus sp. P96]